MTVSERRTTVASGPPIRAIGVWALILAAVLVAGSFEPGDGDTDEAAPQPPAFVDAQPPPSLPSDIVAALRRVAVAREVVARGGPPPRAFGADAQVAAEWAAERMPLDESGSARAALELLCEAERELAGAVATSARAAAHGARDEAVRWAVGWGGGDAVERLVRTLDTPETVRLHDALTERCRDVDRGLVAAIILARARAGDADVEGVVVDALSLDDGDVLAIAAEAASWLGPLRPVPALRRALGRTHSTAAAWAIARALGPDLDRSDLQGLVSRRDVPAEDLARVIASASRREPPTPMRAEAWALVRALLDAEREPSTAAGWTRLAARGVTPLDLRVAERSRVAGDVVRLAIDAELTELRAASTRPPPSDGASTTEASWIPLARVAWERRARLSARLIESMVATPDRVEACLVLAQLGLRRGFDALSEMATRPGDLGRAVVALRALRQIAVVAPDDAKVGDPEAWAPLASWIRRDGIPGIEDALVRNGVITAAEAAERKQPVVQPLPSSASTRAR